MKTLIKQLNYNITRQQHTTKTIIFDNTTTSVRLAIIINIVYKNILHLGSFIIEKCLKNKLNNI